METTISNIKFFRLAVIALFAFALLFGCNDENAAAVVDEQEASLEYDDFEGQLIGVGALRDLNGISNNNQFNRFPSDFSGIDETLTDIEIQKESVVRDTKFLMGGIVGQEDSYHWVAEDYSESQVELLEPYKVNVYQDAGIVEQEPRLVDNPEWYGNVDHIDIDSKVINPDVVDFGQQDLNQGLGDLERIPEELGSDAGQLEEIDYNSGLENIENINQGQQFEREPEFFGDINENAPGQNQGKTLYERLPEQLGSEGRDLLDVEWNTDLDSLDDLIPHNGFSREPENLEQDLLGDDQRIRPELPQVGSPELDCLYLSDSRLVCDVDSESFVQLENLEKDENSRVDDYRYSGDVDDLGFADIPEFP